MVIIFQENITLRKKKMIVSEMEVTELEDSIVRLILEDPGVKREKDVIDKVANIYREMPETLNESIDQLIKLNNAFKVALGKAYRQKFYSMGRDALLSASQKCLKRIFDLLKKCNFHPNLEKARRTLSQTAVKVFDELISEYYKSGMYSEKDLPHDIVISVRHRLVRFDKTNEQGKDEHSRLQSEMFRKNFEQYCTKHSDGNESKLRESDKSEKSK